MRYAVVVERGESGGNCSAYSPDVPGCIATGDTVEQTLENMREALEFHVRGLVEDGEGMPEGHGDGTTVALVDVGAGEPAVSWTASVGPRSVSYVREGPTDAALVDLAGVVAVLRSIEWAGPGGSCPRCGARGGHSVGCLLAEALQQSSATPASGR